MTDCVAGHVLIGALGSVVAHLLTLEAFCGQCFDCQQLGYYADKWKCSNQLLLVCAAISTQQQQQQQQQQPVPPFVQSAYQPLTFAARTISFCHVGLDLAICPSKLITIMWSWA
jgi:hypothetical protein